MHEMSSIYNVPAEHAKVTFQLMLDEEIQELKEQASAWFNLAYKKPGSVVTDEMILDHESRCCNAAKCLIDKFKSLEVTMAPVIKRG